MTREEAINSILEISTRDKIGNLDFLYKEEIDALGMAIKALEAMDNTQNTLQHVECIGEKIRVPMLEDAIKHIAWYCAKHLCSECLLAKGDEDECIRFNIPCDWIDWLEEGDR